MLLSWRPATDPGGAAVHQGQHTAFIYTGMTPATLQWSQQRDNRHQGRHTGQWIRDRAKQQTLFIAGHRQHHQGSRAAGPGCAGPVRGKYKPRRLESDIHPEKSFCESEFLSSTRPGFCCRSGRLAHWRAGMFPTLPEIWKSMATHKTTYQESEK